METSYQAAEWASEEFESAVLNDTRNVSRLVQIATRVAERPRPKVSVLSAVENRVIREGPGEGDRAR